MRSIRPGLRIWSLSLLISLPFLLYISLAAIMYFRQVELIFAGSAWKGRPESFIENPPPWLKIERLRTTSGVSVVAGFASASNADGSPHPSPESRPTILYCYGSGHFLKSMIPMIDGLRRDGLNVIVPEYVGYGMSSGVASEDGCFESAEASYRYLLSRNDVDPNRIVVEGGSLGAAVAVDLAAKVPVAGLMMMSGFTSITDMSKLRYNWLPVDLLLNHPMNSVAKISRVSCPIFIAHGTNDQTVPYWMSERLVDAAPGSPIHLRIVDADHLDTLYLCGPSGALLPTSMRGPHSKFTDEVHKTIQDFFSRALGNPSTTRAMIRRSELSPFDAHHEMGK